MTSRPYYILVERSDDSISPWSVQFGDFDKETVTFERQEMIEGYQSIPASRLKVIKVKSAKQAHIDEKIEELNSNSNAITARRNA